MTASFRASLAVSGQICHLLFSSTTDYDDRMDHWDNKQPTPTLANLYPNLTPEQVREAEHNLRRYAALVWRICQRLEKEREKSGFS